MVQLLHLKVTQMNQGIPLIIDNPIKANKVVLNTVSIKIGTKGSTPVPDLFLRTNFMSALSNLGTSNVPLLRTSDSVSLWTPKVPIALKQQGLVSRINYDIVDDMGITVNMNTYDIESIDLLISFTE